MPEHPDQVFPKVLGKVVAHVRKKERLSQIAFAERIGVTQSMLSRIEQGLTTPDAVVFRRLAAGMGMTSDALYQLVDQAMERTKKLAVATDARAKSSADWWDAAVTVLGVIGITSLIVVAVAALMESQGK